MTVKLIAEIGCNFSSINEACYMIDQAKAAGADFVKFQLFNYQTIKDSPLVDKLLPLILFDEEVKTLHVKADAVGIGFILTPMYLEAVDIAAKYADIIKIRYKDHENQELIDKAIDTNKPVLISVPIQPINSFSIRTKYLFCIPKYPPEPEDFCLDFAAACNGGFSSHYPHTTFDLAYAINRLYEDVYIEKHVMIPHSEAMEKARRECPYPKNGLHEHPGVYVPHPIDEDVSITFEKLKSFISELKLIERIRRIRL